MTPDFERLCKAAAEAFSGFNYAQHDPDDYAPAVVRAVLAALREPNEDAAPDWRKILVTYIDHVRTYEGIDFLPGDADDLQGLSAEERAALCEAAIETVPARDVHKIASLLKAVAELRKGQT